MKAIYRHTNIISKDWNKLAQFYETVFGCIRVPPERQLSGKWLDKGTGVAGAKISGVQLRLPGHGDTGPTLEIFQYAENGGICFVGSQALLEYITDLNDVVCINHFRSRSYFGNEWAG